jgi:hypothetical protein
MRLVEFRKTAARAPPGLRNWRACTKLRSEGPAAVLMAGTAAVLSRFGPVTSAAVQPRLRSAPVIHQRWALTIDDKGRDRRSAASDLTRQVKRDGRHSANCPTPAVTVH